jgi:hypothetical protein
MCAELVMPACHRKTPMRTNQREQTKSTKPIAAMVNVNTKALTPTHHSKTISKDVIVNSSVPTFGKYLVIPHPC